MNESYKEEIERVVVSVKDLGHNAKEYVYKQKRNNANEKLFKIKQNVTDNKFYVPFKKRKREVEKNENDLERSDLVKIKEENEGGEFNAYSQILNNFKNSQSSLNVNNLDKDIFAEFIETDNEEYDPNYPNDYEQIVKDIKRKRKEKELELKTMRKKKVTRMDKILSEGVTNSVNISTNVPKSQTKVRKMLEKMGWKGQGLGKYEQGIITPLIMKKTNEKYGIIINSNTQTSEKKITLNLDNFYNRTPTKILMITNMVYPNEINNETYNEIRHECENYGIVNDIKFFHFHGDDLPISEAVRVFIEYNSVEFAIKAFENLYDRFFSERLIRVKFYDEQLYHNQQLDSFNYS